MKIGITGVAGFIGVNLAKALLEKGHHVIGVDNLSFGTKTNVAILLSNPRFTFYSLDILELSKLQEAFQSTEILIHLAALKIPRYENALATLKVNTEGAENLLKVASQLNVKTILASTSDVYGKSQALPFQEEGELVVGPPTVKRWSYAISKMYEEQLAFAYGDAYQFPVVLLRFFGGYGPFQNLTWRGGPQPVFIQKAMAGEALPLHGDGKQTRTFTYISDIVDGILLCLENKEANNEVFNIGNDVEVTIEELACLIWKLVREDPPKLEYIPYSNFGKYEDVVRRKPCLKKSKSVLGFVPKVDLTEGLKQTINWQQSLEDKKE